MIARSFWKRKCSRAGLPAGEHGGLGCETEYVTGPRDKTTNERRDAQAPELFGRRSCRLIHGSTDQFWSHQAINTVSLPTASHLPETTPGRASDCNIILKNYRWPKITTAGISRARQNQTRPLPREQSWPAGPPVAEASVRRFGNTTCDPLSLDSLARRIPQPHAARVRRTLERRENRASLVRRECVLHRNSRCRGNAR